MIQEMIKLFGALWGKIRGIVLQSLSWNIGEQCYVYTKLLTIPHGQSKEDTFRTPGFDIWVNLMKVTLYSNGSYITSASATRDKVTLQMRDGNGNNIFGGDAIDALDVNDFGMHQNFEGYMLAHDTTLTYTLAHTESNTTTDIEAKIEMYGKKVDKEKLLQPPQ